MKKLFELKNRWNNAVCGIQNIIGGIVQDEEYFFMIDNLVGAIIEKRLLDDEILNMVEFIVIKKEIELKNLSSN